MTTLSISTSIPFTVNEIEEFTQLFKTIQYNQLCHITYDTGDVYSGDTEDGYRNGMGEVLFRNGDMFASKWKKNEIVGKGVYITADGTHYIGINFSFQGSGKIKFPDGSIYIGEIDHGMHGKGKIIYSDGSFYEGNFYYDKYHGKGEQTFVNGYKYTGDFYLGEKCGEGIFIYRNGNYIGEWKNDTFHGKGILDLRKTGNIYIGPWDNGQQTENGIIIRFK
jgi:hypothetical protein